MNSWRASSFWGDRLSWRSMCCREMESITRPRSFSGRASGRTLRPPARLAALACATAPGVPVKRMAARRMEVSPSLGIIGLLLRARLGLITAERRKKYAEFITDEANGRNRPKGQIWVSRTCVIPIPQHDQGWLLEA